MVILLPRYHRAQVPVLPPTESRRWRRVLSDTESDGFDDVDSLYGESESNVSFGQYKVSFSDVVSFSAYGGDSDAFVDLHGFLDTETIIQTDYGRAFDSDIDIDPMHAGLNPWNSDDPEQDDEYDDDDEEDEEDDEWEEVEYVDNIVGSAEANSQPQNPLILSSGRRNRPVNMHQWRHITEADGLLSWGMRGRNSHDILSNFDDPDMMPYVTNSGDYLDALGFEELLEHLAQAESLRLGAPPAAVSFLNNLPLILISKEHDKHDDLACAICKDVLTIGTVMNQLPCFHLYH